MRRSKIVRISRCVCSVLGLTMLFSCGDYLNDKYTQQQQQEQQQQLKEGLVAYWPITGDSYTYQEDYSGNGNTLQIVSGDQSSIASGKFSTALSFGKNDMLTKCMKNGTAGEFFMPESNAVSVTMWVMYKNATDLNYFYPMLCGVSSFKLVAYHDAIGFYGPNSSPSSTQLQFTMSPNTWYHIAGVYDRKTVRLYVNGELFESTDVDASNSVAVPSSTYIYVKSAPGDWNGMLDELRVYSRVLSQDEIKTIMNMGID